jgi:cytochrome c-type biogenesis protein CcmH/NrfF
MILLWLIPFLVVLLSSIVLWRRLEQGFCVSALCLLQSIEERFDEYFDKPAALRYNTRLQRLC